MADAHDQVSEVWSDAEQSCCFSCCACFRRVFCFWRIRRTRGRRPNIDIDLESVASEEVPESKESPTTHRGTSHAHSSNTNDPLSTPVFSEVGGSQMRTRPSNHTLVPSQSNPNFPRGSQYLPEVQVDEYPSRSNRAVPMRHTKAPSWDKSSPLPNTHRVARPSSQNDPRPLYEPPKQASTSKHTISPVQLTQPPSAMYGNWGMNTTSSGNLRTAAAPGSTRPAARRSESIPLAPPSTREVRGMHTASSGNMRMAAASSSTGTTTKSPGSSSMAPPSTRDERNLHMHMASAGNMRRAAALAAASSSTTLTPATSPTTPPSAREGKGLQVRNYSEVDAQEHRLQVRALQEETERTLAEIKHQRGVVRGDGSTFQGSNW